MRRKIIIDKNIFPHDGENIRWEESIGMNVNFTIYPSEQVYSLEISGYNDGMITIKYKNSYKTITEKTLLSGSFVRFINPYVQLRDDKLKYHDKKPGDIFTIKNKSYKILIVKVSLQKIDEHRHRRKVWFYLECMDCGYRFWRVSNAISSLACENCNHVAVIPGINDIVSTDPWMVSYFQGGEEEAKQYRKESQKTIIPICPCCKKILNSLTVNRIYKQGGVYCPYCSDRITFPEKFMSSLLRQLNIDYVREANTVLPFDAGRKLYDFYIKNISCIIETHGIQHYEETSFPKSLKEQQEDDCYKYQLAINGGIKHYIVIDCRKSELEWIKKSILDSCLPQLLNFQANEIDWEQCYIDACSNIKKQVWDYYNNYYPTLKELSSIFKIHSQTIGIYLKQGNELGICKYDGNLERYMTPIEVFHNDQLLFTGLNITDVANKLKEYVGIDKKPSAIQKYISNIQSLQGYTFKRVRNRERRREILYGHT